MSLAYDATKGHKDVQGLGYILCPCQWLRTVLSLGPWYCLDQHCCLGPCLGLWPYSNQGLC